MTTCHNRDGDSYTSSAPLRTGPGGEYTRDWTPDLPPGPAGSPWDAADKLAVLVLLPIAGVTVLGIAGGVWFLIERFF